MGENHCHGQDIPAVLLHTYGLRIYLHPVLYYMPWKTEDCDMGFALRTLVLNYFWEKNKEIPGETSFLLNQQIFSEYHQCVSLCFRHRGHNGEQDR